MHVANAAALGEALIRSTRHACRDEQTCAWEERMHRFDPHTPIVHRRTLRRIERMLVFAASRGIVTAHGARRLAMLAYDAVSESRRLVMGPTLMTDEEEFWPRVERLETVLHAAWCREVWRARLGRWLGIFR